MPWGTNQIAVDLTGTGLIFVWQDGQDGGSAQAVPLSRAIPTIAGVFRAEETEAEAGGAVLDPPPRALRPTNALVPLGIPTEMSQKAEDDNQADNDRRYTAAFKIRVALPGFLGETLTATAETLRVRPPEEHVAKPDLGPARVMPGGPGWPETEVEVDWSPARYDRAAL